jgi:hypothetical protein
VFSEATARNLDRVKAFITSLATSGVHPKDAQTLARHSTITLTMDRYSHVSLRDSAFALAMLTMPSRQSSTVVEATGTDDAVAEMVAGVSDNHGDSMSPIETTNARERIPENATIPLKTSGFQGDYRR